MSENGFSEQKKKTVFELLRQQLDKTGYVDFDIGSPESMLPFFKANDSVRIKKIGLKNVCRGDLVAYQLRYQICVHRCIYKFWADGRFNLRTKGDHRSFLDGYTVTEEQFIGKVISLKRENKNIHYETLHWRVINYFLAHLSIIQAIGVREFQTIKRKFFQKPQ